MSEDRRGGDGVRGVMPVVLQLAVLRFSSSTFFVLYSVVLWITSPIFLPRFFVCQ